MGKANPFKVPDGYFETLAETAMSSLPEEHHRRRRLWRYAAAACFLAALTTTILFFGNGITEEQQVAQSKEMDIEQVADYVMIDNHDIYACLFDEY